MSNIIHVPPEVNKYLSDPNKAAILIYLMSRKGTIVTIDTVRPLKFLKEFKNYCGEKRSTFQARVGLNYENQAATKEAREEGREMVGLQGKKWLHYPYITRSLTNNNLYFRFYSIHNSFIPQSKYFINGAEVPKKELEKYCLASEYKERESPQCFDFPLQGIEKVH